MKSITEYINESYQDFDIEDVAYQIISVAQDNLGNKFKRATPEDIIDSAAEGEYTDYDYVAELLECDPDELCDFIDDNYDELIKIINKLK